MRTIDKINNYLEIIKIIDILWTTNHENKRNQREKEQMSITDIWNGWMSYFYCKLYFLYSIE
jgi:hypothetical protein